MPSKTAHELINQIREVQASTTDMRDLVELPESERKRILAEEQPTRRRNRQLIAALSVTPTYRAEDYAHKCELVLRHQLDSDLCPHALIRACEKLIALDHSELAA